MNGGSPAIGAIDPLHVVATLGDLPEREGDGANASPPKVITYERRVERRRSRPRPFMAPRRAFNCHERHRHDFRQVESSSSSRGFAVHTCLEELAPRNLSLTTPRTSRGWDFSRHDLSAVPLARERRCWTELITGGAVEWARDLVVGVLAPHGQVSRVVLGVGEPEAAVQRQAEGTRLQVRSAGSVIQSVADDSRHHRCAEAAATVL